MSSFNKGDTLLYLLINLQGRIIRGTYRFQAIITTFEMILGGCPELNAIEWRCVIIDEAHRLKNKNCKLLEGLKLMNLVSDYILFTWFNKISVKTI